MPPLSDFDIAPHPGAWLRKAWYSTRSGAPSSCGAQSAGVEPAIACLHRPTAIAEARAAP
eukprot:1700665-Rhodomonas_salina.1